MKKMGLSLKPPKLQTKFKMRRPRVTVKQGQLWANSDIPQTYTIGKKKKNIY